MLRSWSASNFKSIRESQELQLAPLTIFAGANNSGKSSFLQSILILTQTIRSMSDEPSLVLDGELFRRGEAEDLIHAGQKAMSFHLVADVEGRQPPAVQAAEQVEVKIDLRIGSAAGGEKRFELLKSSLRVLDAEGHPFDAIQVERRRSWRGNLGTQPPAWLRSSDLVYREVPGEERYADVVAVSMSHFLPLWAIERRDARLERSQELLRYMFLPAHRQPQDDDEWLEAETLELVRVLLNEPNLESTDALTVRQRNILRSYRGPDVPRRARRLFARLKGDYRWRRRPLRGLLEDAVDSLGTLASRVRHLGPLRLPPQYVYAVTPYAQEGSVGSAGEFTVAQLYRKGDSRVRSVDPTTNTIENVPLQIAIEKWLKHMGVAEKLLIWHRPKVGHYLSVMPPDHLTYETVRTTLPEL